MRARLPIFKIALLILSFTLGQCGLIQELVDYVTKVYEIPHIKVDDKLEEGFKNAIKILISPHHQTT